MRIKKNRNDDGLMMLLTCKCMACFGIELKFMHRYERYDAVDREQSFQNPTNDWVALNIFFFFLVARIWASLYEFEMEHLSEN